jgi:hypothetical protein
MNKLLQTMLLLAALVAAVEIVVPAVVRLVDALFIPAVVAVGLYLVVRIVNARLNRW